MRDPLRVALVDEMVGQQAAYAASVQKLAQEKDPASAVRRSALASTRTERLNSGWKSVA